VEDYGIYLLKRVNKTGGAPDQCLENLNGYMRNKKTRRVAGFLSGFNSFVFL